MRLFSMICLRQNALIWTSCHTLVMIILFSFSANAQQLKADGTDTAKVNKLIADGKKEKLASDGKNLLKTAADLDKLGNSANSKVALLYASLYRSHAAWMVSNYTDMLKYALEALSRSQAWHINNKLPEIYAYIGTVYKENLDYPKAIAAIDKAVQAARDLNDTVAMINNYRTQAMFIHGYAFNNDTSKAVFRTLLHRSFVLHMQGLKLAKSSPKFELSSIGYYSNISQYYLEQRDYKNAEIIAVEGISLAAKYKQFKSLTYTYTWLGEAYFQQGDRVKGIALVKKALALCKEHHFKFREMEVYSGLEDCYARMGDYKNAWIATNKWQAINDSLNIIKNVQKLDEMNVKYQTVEKDTSIKLLNQSSKQKNSVFMLGGIVMLLLIAFTVIIYRQKNRVSRANLSLAESNKTINDQAVKLETLLKELHHRVKNNLQIVTSLLKLQANRLTDEDAVHAIRDSQQRIEAMSLIHRTLYQQEDSSLVNMKLFITELVTSIMNSFGLGAREVEFGLNINVQEMDIDLALPLGLMINELVINSIKHAFTGGPDQFKLHINLHYNDDCRLEVSDNGPGIPPTVWENPKNSFGIKLIKLLTTQLGGKSQMISDHGTHFKLEIKAKQF